MKSVLLILSVIFVFSLILTGYTQAVDMKTAFLIYTFEEGNGVNVKDQSGNGNDGVITGANAKWVNGKIGGGLTLAGANHSIKSVTTNGVGKTFFSECIWANFADLATEQQFGYIKCAETASARYFYFSSWCSLGAPNDALHCGTLDKAGAWGRGLSAPRLFKTKQWYHIAGVIDTKNGFIRVYVDGAMALEQKIDTGDTPGVPKEIWVGGSSENYQWINGTIDEVAMFNVALTEADINTIMKDGVGKAKAVQSAGKLPVAWALLKSR